MKMKYVSIVLSTGNISCMGGVACTSFRRSRLFITSYQFSQDIFFGFGSIEANIIPSLASCIEIYFFSSSWFRKHRGRRKFVRCVQIIGKAISQKLPMYQSNDLYDLLNVPSLHIQVLAP